MVGEELGREGERGCLWALTPTGSLSAASTLTASSLTGFHQLRRVLSFRVERGIAPFKGEPERIGALESFS